MKFIASIILAAGQGKRMKSSFPKVLHHIAGQSMLSYSLGLSKLLGIKKKLVVVGHQADIIKKEINKIEDDVTFVYQEEQLGTAHAIQQTRPHLIDFSGIILVLSGDVPLLKPSTIKEMVDYHTKHKASCTLLTANLDHPDGYGRIVRDQQGAITGIFEQSDLKKGLEQIKEINAGVYCFNAQELFAALMQVKPDNRQKEYYLTDVIKILIEKGSFVANVAVQDSKEIIGVNTRMDLSRVTSILYERNASFHMSNGVSIIDPTNIFIENQVEIGQDTIIYPFTIITKGTKIGKSCNIGPYSHIVNSQIGCNTKIHSSVVENSQIGSYSTIGPYSHIRPDSIISNEVKIGNYVEVKKSFIGKRSKVGHLSYLGDATLGEKVNIGAGTITCNFNGEKKNPTIIEDGVFIGSNNALVAPVTIGRNSYTAAGSTITENVPAKSLGISRPRQKNILNWTDKKNKKKNK